MERIEEIGSNCLEYEQTNAMCELEMYPSRSLTDRVVPCMHEKVCQHEEGEVLPLANTQFGE